MSADVLLIVLEAVALAKEKEFEESVFRRSQNHPDPKVEASDNVIVTPDPETSICLL